MGATAGRANLEGGRSDGEPKENPKGSERAQSQQRQATFFLGAPRTRGIDGRSGRQAANAASGARRYGRRTADSRATAPRDRTAFASGRVRIPEEGAERTRRDS